MPTVRRLLTVVGVMAGIALMMSPGAYAAANPSPSPSVSVSPTPTPKPTHTPTPTPTPTPTRAPEPCTTDEWTVYTPANPVGMAYAPNAYAEDSARVTNKTSVDFPDTVFIFGVTAGGDANSGPIPLVRWRVNGGTWHQFHLHKLNLGGGLPYWGTDNVDLPELRSKASYTVTIGMAFPPGTPGRIFDTQFMLGTVECGPANLGEDLSMTYGYYPMPSATKPATRSGSGVTKAGATNTGTPTPTAATPSPPATPEVQASPTAADFLTATPAPSSSTKAARPSRTSGAAWVIAAAVLALGTVCGIAFFRIRRASRS